jgi:cell division protein FtsL
MESPRFETQGDCEDYIQKLERQIAAKDKRIGSLVSQIKDLILAGYGHEISGEGKDGA